MHSYHHPQVPTALTIFEALQDGSEISVHGHVRHGHHKNFAVELLSGSTIVLHVNFRFHHEHVVVMNTAFNGVWGPEIRHRNPLHHSQHFHLRIRVHLGYYHISVNGTHLADYPHRYPFQAVQAIGLKGDVHVEKVHFEGFHFRRQWAGDTGYGHSGYHGYGTDGYAPPVVVTGGVVGGAPPPPVMGGGGVGYGAAPSPYGAPAIGGSIGFGAPQPGYGAPQPGIGGGAQPGYGAYPGAYQQAPPLPQQYNPYR